MVEVLFNNDKEITSVFQLLGTQENDISKSIIWILKECPVVLNKFLTECCCVDYSGEDITIEYQHFEKVEGKYTYTDIEIYNNTFHIIIEAKRGWILPERRQLEIYSKKHSINESHARQKYIFTISECSKAYAQRYLPVSATDNGISVEHISWDEFETICVNSIKDSANKQKYLIREFLKYLGEIETMKNSNSNIVYVVSLSPREAASGYSYIDVVVRSGHYYCPVDWFKNSKNIPNYLGFRYYGKLQSIHHVESYTISKNMHDVLNFMADEEWEKDHYIFTLGPAIHPDHDVRCGKKVTQAVRVYADIDTLLTCNTITEAMQISKERRKE